MDLVVTVPHLPRAGETVLGERLGRYPGGKGANQAVAAPRLGARVLLNAAPAHPLDPGLLDQVDALVVNEGEARAIVDKASPEAAAAALRAIGPRIAVVTLGPAGSVFCDESGVHHVEPFPVKAVDATGAGDAFVGALA